MKKIILFCVFTFLFTSQAFAEIYLSAKAGYSFVSGNYDEPPISLPFDDNGFKGSFALGYLANFKKYGIRVEFEYDIYDKIKSDENRYLVYTYSDIIPVNVHLKGQRHSVHANFYVDFKTGTIVTPYVGLGIGVGIVNGDATTTAPTYGVKGSFSESYIGASLQGMLGVAINLHKHIALDVGYKLNYYTKPKDSENISMDLLSNDLHAGLRFTF